MNRDVFGYGMGNPSPPPRTLDTQRDAVNAAWRSLAGLRSFIDFGDNGRFVVGNITINHLVLLYSQKDQPATLLSFQQAVLRMVDQKVRVDMLNVTVVQINQQGREWRLNIPSLTFYVDNDWFLLPPISVP